MSPRGQRTPAEPDYELVAVPARVADLAERRIRTLWTAWCKNEGWNTRDKPKDRAPDLQWLLKCCYVQGAQDMATAIVSRAVDVQPCSLLPNPTPEPIWDGVWPQP